MLVFSHRSFFTLFCLFITLVSSGQSSAIDSLKRELSRANTDSVRIDLQVKLAVKLSAVDYKEALFYATNALALSEKSGFDVLKMKASRVTGSVCMLMGLNKIAAEHHNREYNIAVKLGDTLQSGIAYFNLASVYLALEDYQKSGQVMSEAVRLMTVGYALQNKPLPDLILLMYRMNLANISLNLGEYKRSDSLIRLSMPMAKDVSGMESKLLSLYHIEAMLRLKMKQPDSALSSLRLSRALAERLGDDASFTATFLSAGEAYEIKGDDLSAIREYSEGYRRAARINGLALKQLTAEHLYKLYRKVGRGDSSVRYFELFTAFQQESKSAEAKEALMREDLQRSYSRMVADLSHRDRQSRRGYLTVIVLVVLASAVFLAGFLFYRRRYRRLQLDRVRREMEAKRLMLETERLQAELEHREAELERISLELKKTSLIEGLVSEQVDGQTVSGRKLLDVDSVRGVLTTDLKTKAWEEFEYRFQQIHSGFYERLRQSHPELTMNERRLCAFLRLDMTTKEISDITGQSIRAIKMARVRLRSKLGLTNTEQEIFDFLSGL
jgi:tetratricopeptide (TPR) repeat protein/DNA-binding CsgD family transcriptional regulator